MAAFFLLGPVSTYKFNMSQATPTLSSLSSSRLVSLLTEMTSAKVTVSGRHFSEKLGSFLDMSDSITLSEAHASLSRLSYEPLLTEVADIQDVFLHARRDMVASVTRSFSPGSSPLGIKLPIRENNNLADKPLSFSPYHRFYAAHQRDLDIKVSSLHCQIRDMVAGISPGMAQLSLLDKVLTETFVSRTRKFLNTVPRLLGVHFENLAQAEGESTDAWLDQFCGDMKAVLLAEIEVRLMPVLGLVESAAN